MHDNFNYDRYENLSSARKIKKAVTRALGRQFQRTNDAFPLLTRQSECNTLVDFEKNSNYEDDTATLSEKPLGQPEGDRARPSRTSRSRQKNDSGPFVGRAQMLEPEDRAWDAPHSNRSTKSKRWSLGKGSDSSNQHARQVRGSSGIKAEMLDDDNRCWM